ATTTGAPLDTPPSYPTITKRPQHVDRDEHADPEGRSTGLRPTGRRYPLVYPMFQNPPLHPPSLVQRPLPPASDIHDASQSPRLKIITGYSFGLDDQEFVVAFESDCPSDFLDLVERLRGGEASAYTERETPIFTCVAGSIAEVLELLG